LLVTRFSPSIPNVVVTFKASVFVTSRYDAR
jgi:hypothetical protein